MTLSPANITSIPINDFAEANEELTNMGIEQYYPCCGKSICTGCVHTFCKSGNIGNCPFCKADHVNKTDEERVDQLMKRVEANDAGAIYLLGTYYHHGVHGLQQDRYGLLPDRERAIELWKKAAALGSSKAHYQLGVYYHEGGDSKKSKLHYEAAAMAGHDDARCNLGAMEYYSGGNLERSVKHSRYDCSIRWELCCHA